MTDLLAMRPGCPHLQRLALDAWQWGQSRGEVEGLAMVALYRRSVEMYTKLECETKTMKANDAKNN